VQSRGVLEGSGAAGVARVVSEPAFERGGWAHGDNGLLTDVELDEIIVVPKFSGRGGT
jgi:hypothetical protein